MPQRQSIYRIIFTQQDKLYEIYAQYISEEQLMGFIEVEELIFTEPSSKVVVDPNEERLRSEFKGVKRCYIPMHVISRIDEVIHEGSATIKELKGDNISHFPSRFVPQPNKPTEE